jgi:hypothetical protein
MLSLAFNWEEQQTYKSNSGTLREKDGRVSAPRDVLASLCRAGSGSQ